MYIFGNAIHKLSALPRTIACCCRVPCLKKGGNFHEMSSHERAQAKLWFSRKQPHTYVGKFWNFHIKKSQELED